MTSNKIDFDRLRAAHPLPDVIRASGVDLIADGNEYRALCPFHSEKTPSFTVYRNETGDWKCHCFGCGAGGDVFQYVQDYYQLSNAGEAARFLQGDDKPDAKPVTPAKSEHVNPYAGYEVLTPPGDAPVIRAAERTPPLMNPKRGKIVTYMPSMVFPYHDASGALIGYVLRVEFDDKKITPGIWWMRNAETGFEGWSHGSLPSPRPMYGLRDLANNRANQVLLVEGEKCTDAARRALAGVKITPASWMGGGKSIAKTDWSPLAGRSVLIWPDADAEGWNTAMDLVPLLRKSGVARIKIIHPPETMPDGWDIADAERDGTDIGAFIRDHIQDWPADRLPQKTPHVTVRPAIDPDPAHTPVPADDDRPNAFHTPAVIAGQRRTGPSSPGWNNRIIMTKDGDSMLSWSTANAMLLSAYHENFRGTLMWNEFANEAYVAQPAYWVTGETREHPRRIDDGDISGLRRELEYFGVKMKSSDMGAIIQDVAKLDTYNPVRDALDAMTWDGVPRLQGGMWEGDSVTPWLAEYCGAENTEINRLFGMKWLISAVARAFRPGCKVDTILIFESGQGFMKSTAFKVLADAVCDGVFTDDIGEPGSKDSVLQIQGKLIAEIAELTAVSKADVRKTKEWVSRATDRMRRPYGKTSEEFPRSCVYVGTVNPGGTGYLKDPTGARRFWPVKVMHEIDIARLKADAPQLWAEAVHLFKQGATWWLSRQEEELARAVQRDRYQEDPWSELINQFCVGKDSVRIMEIMGALEIPKERRDQRAFARIADDLHHKGWVRSADDRGTIYVRGN